MIKDAFFVAPISFKKPSFQQILHTNIFSFNNKLSIYLNLISLKLCKELK